MSAGNKVDGNTAKNANRMGPANFLLYIACGSVLLATFAIPSQDAGSQAGLLTITLSTITFCLGAYVLRLEARITALESQHDHGEDADHDEP